MQNFDASYENFRAGGAGNLSLRASGVHVLLRLFEAGFNLRLTPALRPRLYSGAAPRRPSLRMRVQMPSCNRITREERCEPTRLGRWV